MLVYLVKISIYGESIPDGCACTAFDLIGQRAQTIHIEGVSEFLDLR